MATSESNATGKQFAPPFPGRAALYVLTTKKAGTTWALTLGQRNLGVMDNSQWLRVDVPAGTYDLRCSSVILRDAPAVLPLTMPEGSISFAAASYITLGNPSCRLQAVADDFGRREVLAGTRIREVGGASD